MSARTRFLGRLIGLYCILISLAMFAHRQAFVEMATALLHNPPVLLLAGLIAMTAGLAMVLGHNVWSGGALPVVVTLAGWASLMKGALILLLSQEAESGFFLGALHYEQYFYAYASFTLLLGIYLTVSASQRR
jgi:hypothetical protein